MCGICGVISKNRIGPKDAFYIDKINEALFHRGPDSSGVYKDKNVILAMRRLSIIDLAGGSQPLFSENNNIALIANAEIYNYIELTGQLKSRGHVFKTGSDCETIVHLYEEKGINCLQDLRGMFALALWDIPKRRLFLARDRGGEKPLYLYEEKDTLIFSSELKSLLKILPDNFLLDHSAVDLFFHYQYVPEPMTPVKKIKRLAAAHYIDINIADWDAKPKRYWDPMAAPPIDTDPISVIRCELDRISSFTLRSDVSVGIALSGGLDSGAIAALSAPKVDGRLSAFSVGYPGYPWYDERKEAETLARQLGMPFYNIELLAGDFADTFPEIVSASDELIADLSAYGYYSVMKLAHEHGIKVILSGFGGDELFWGYDWVRNALKLNQKKSEIISGLGRNKFISRIHYWLRYGSAPADQMIFYDLEQHFRYAHPRLSGLYTDEFRKEIAPQNSYSLFKLDAAWESIDIDFKICQLLNDIWLISNCIDLGDRLSMAFSVELRLPFIDYRLNEVVFGLRKKIRDSDLRPKEWLRESMRGILPDNALERPKRGFAVPERDWNEAILKDYSLFAENGYLVENNIFDRKRLKRYLASAKRSGDNLEQRLAYKIIFLELWCRLFLWRSSVEEIKKETRKR